MADDFVDSAQLFGACHSWAAVFSSEASPSAAAFSCSAQAGHRFGLRRFENELSCRSL